PNPAGAGRHRGCPSRVADGETAVLDECGGENVLPVGDRRRRGRLLRHPLTTRTAPTREGRVRRSGPGPLLARSVQIAAVVQTGPLLKHSGRSPLRDSMIARTVEACRTSSRCASPLLRPRTPGRQSWTGCEAAAVVCTLVCFAPLGIAAVVYAGNVRTRLALGDIEGARRASRMGHRLWWAGAAVKM